MKTLHVTTRQEWRRWLKARYRTEEGVWLVFYKRHTGKPRLVLDEAIEEALCFGWIDGMIKKIDDERWAKWFTPRRDGSTWSELNLARARKLIESRQMTKAGIEALGSALETGPTSRRPSTDLTVPTDVERALRGNRRAWQNFQGLAPSYRRRYLGWIGDA